MKSKLTEGLQSQDLARLVHDVIHIDEFTSKMGENRDIITISFRVKGREPANDLVGWLERGYDWVLDAEVSPGEMDDGWYLVFLELERKRRAVPQILTMLEEMSNLVDFTKWQYVYYEGDKIPVSAGNLQTSIPLSPREYRLMREPDEPALGIEVDSKETEESLEFEEDISEWREIAGTYADSVVDDELRHLQSIARIK